MTAGVRFPHLNLWRNPFGELTAEERMRLAVCDLDPLLRWLECADGAAGSRRVLQFIGPCGHGKSTHLRALQRRLSGVRYVYVPPAPPYSAIPAAGPLIVDEADRLPTLVRWRLLRRRDLVAVGVHRSLARPLRWCGAETWTVEVANGGCPHRLRRMLNRRILASAHRPGPLPLVSLADARYLILRYGDDIRAIESYLYERFQQLGRDPHGEM